MAGGVVAFLAVHVAGATQERQARIRIRGNEQFYLGRSPALCRYHWSDSSISNKHLRIHCVLYEQDPVSGIPPLVYATDVSSNGTVLRTSATGGISAPAGLSMSKQRRSRLLEHGDVLLLSRSVTLVFHSLVPTAENDFTAVQERETNLFQSRYLVTGRTLGVGGFGKVLVALQASTQRQLACKVVETSCDQPTDRKRNGSLGKQGALHRWPTYLRTCFREFDILKDLSHPNIVTIEKVFWSASNIYIFQELVTGGDLFSYLEYKGGCLCDTEAAVIVRQILKGIDYLHDRDIVHRDLKPDNILMTSLDEGARVVITDFGNARWLPQPDTPEERWSPLKRRMFSEVGTLEYTAPEIFGVNCTISADEGYSKTVDMWSVGALTAALVSGDVLFVDRTNWEFGDNPKAVILNLAAKCDLSVLDSVDHSAWSRIGCRPKDFIRNLLVLDETHRMTAPEALGHAWFSHKQYAAEFDTLYERATRDWQPRRKIFRLVEPVPSAVSTSYSKRQVPIRRSSSGAQVSRYFSLSRRRPSSVELGIQSPPLQLRQQYSPHLATPAQRRERLDDAARLFSSESRVLEPASIDSICLHASPPSPDQEPGYGDGSVEEQQSEDFGPVSRQPSPRGHSLSVIPETPLHNYGTAPLLARKRYPFYAPIGLDLHQTSMAEAVRNAYEAPCTASSIEHRTSPEQCAQASPLRIHKHGKLLF